MFTHCILPARNTTAVLEVLLNAHGCSSRVYTYCRCNTSVFPRNNDYNTQVCKRYFMCYVVVMQHFVLPCILVTQWLIVAVFAIHFWRFPETSALSFFLALLCFANAITRSMLVEKRRSSLFHHKSPCCP